MAVLTLNQIADELVDLMLKLRTHSTCLTCEHFNPVTEGCGQAGGQRPPARVIVMACPKYIEQVPF